MFLPEGVLEPGASISVEIVEHAVERAVGVALLGVGQVGKAVGMDPALQVEIGLLQPLLVDAEGRRQAEERKVILLEIEHRGRSRLRP